MTSSIKILCVEDSVNVQQMLSFILTKAGYEPHVASGGHEAIEKTVGLKPDLILMDVMMPDLSGIQTIRQIKLNAVSKYIPIIVLSAYNSHKLINQAMDAGASRYLDKSIIPDELIKVIQQELKNSNVAVK